MDLTAEGRLWSQKRQRRKVYECFLPSDRNHAFAKNVWNGQRPKRLQKAKYESDRNFVRYTTPQTGKLTPQ